MTTAAIEALEPRPGAEAIDRIARRWLRAYVAAPMPARAVYLAGERAGLTAEAIRSGMKRSGLRWVQIDNRWHIRKATPEELDAARRAAVTRGWRR